jgi:shikimate kinase
MNAETRLAIRQQALSVWLKADLDTLMGRVMKKQHRPLLKSDDPRAVMERLMAVRYPVYAEADITVLTRDDKRELIADEVMAAVEDHLRKEAGRRHG